jgi:hypothetical protein
MAIEGPEVIVSGIEARPTLEKLQNTDKDLRERHFLTGQRLGPSRRGLDVVPMGFYEVADDVIESGSDDNLVILTAHTAKKGDFLRINTSTNSINEYEVSIDEIVSANSFRLGTVLSASLSAGDTVTILRPVLPKHNSDGSQYVVADAAPIYFRKDGSLQEVVEDTVTPANNEPLPVKLFGVNGTLNLTANDLDISSSHTEDSIRLGDGNNLTEVTADNELKTHDAQSISFLTAIDTILNSIYTMEADLLTSLQAIQAEDFATETTLAQCRTNLADIEALIALTNGHVDGLEAALTTLNGKDFATQTTLAALLTELQAKADLSETQPVSAASLPLPTGASTEAKQDTANTSLNNIDTDLGAPADAAVSNPASSGSVIALLKGLLTLITSTNTKLDTLETNGSPEFNSTTNVTATANTLSNAPAGARWMQIQNSTQASAALRFTQASTTPTASVGFFLDVGQSTPLLPAGNVRTISVDGAAIDCCITWFV